MHAMVKRHAAELPAWDDVRFFLAVHRAGSLSAAARPLGVTQPTCGRRLSALERALGLHLFDRTPDGFQLTAHGRSLLEPALRMEREASALTLKATSRDEQIEGVVRIATNELFASTFLVGALGQIRERHPALRFELVLSNAETDLLRREADLALRFGPQGSRPQPRSLVARKLGDEPFFLYGTEAYLRRRGTPKAAEALQGHEVVVFAGRHPAANWCARAFRGATVALSVASMQVAATAIGAGLGLGVLPRRAARMVPGLQTLSPPIAAATGWLIVHPQLRAVPRIRAVGDQLLEAFSG
jgi:DNA-binding transcriptional LysR family regulator